MANTPQAKKRARQAVKRRSLKASQRSMMRTAIKKVVAAIDAGDKAAAEATLKAARPVLDSMVNKGIIHKNKANRHKSNLSARIKSLA